MLFENSCFVASGIDFSKGKFKIVQKFLVLPRIVFDEWTRQDFTNLHKKNEVTALAKTLIEAANKHKFDGYILEVWPQIIQVLEFKGAVTFIKDLGKRHCIYYYYEFYLSLIIVANTLGLQEMETILVIPPKRGKDAYFNSKHFEALYDYVTAFSLMTYDFSNPRMPGKVE